MSEICTHKHNEEKEKVKEDILGFWLDGWIQNMGDIFKHVWTFELLQNFWIMGELFNFGQIWNNWLNNR